MSNFIGYIEGYEPSREDREWELANILMDKKFTPAQNHFIKKERSRLYQVCEVGKEEGSDAASRLIEQIFEENGFDWQDKDNDFCYDLGDKITYHMGGTPSWHYENE